MVQSPNGPRYTRDGSFHRAQNGQLVTEAAEPVLSSAGQPIQIPPGEVTVGADGAVSVAGGVVAQVGVFTFPAGTELTPEGANRYVAPKGIAATPANESSIRQGAIEGANQDVVQGSLELVMMQRQAEMMQRALTVFHTEFNKFATEDLPKI
jgi:flagellar basal-body rod protein FlgF